MAVQDFYQTEGRSRRTAMPQMTSTMRAPMTAPNKPAPKLAVGTKIHWQGYRIGACTKETRCHREIPNVGELPYAIDQVPAWVGQLARLHSSFSLASLCIIGTVLTRTPLRTRKGRIRRRRRDQPQARRQTRIPGNKTPPTRLTEPRRWD
jgi:hypothetical protein